MDQSNIKSLLPSLKKCSLFYGKSLNYYQVQDVTRLNLKDFPTVKSRQKEIKIKINQICCILTSTTMNHDKTKSRTHMIS